MRLTIVGLGYVGLTTGAALAYLGHRVVGVEKEEAKLKLVCSGKVSIHESGLPELFELAKHNITFTSKTKEAVAEAELIMIAVGTPPKPPSQVAGLPSAFNETSSPYGQTKSSTLNC